MSKRRGKKKSGWLRHFWAGFRETDVIAAWLAVLVPVLLAWWTVQPKPPMPDPKPITAPDDAPPIAVKRTWGPWIQGEEVKPIR